MWCCKDNSEEKKDAFEVTIEKDEDHSGVKEIDVKEWNMTLRENVICLDEHNVRVKKQKIKAIEQIETERKLAIEKEIDEREKELFCQQQILEATRLELEQVKEMEKEISDREEKISQRRQALENREHDLDERDAILEIVVRLNEKEQKIALPLRNLEIVQQELEASDRMLARESQLEEKEEELFLRQRDIEEREFDINDKNAVLEIAIRVNDFRQVNNIIILKYLCWLLL